MSDTDQHLFPLPDQPSDGTSDTASDASDNRISVRLDQQAADDLAALLAGAKDQSAAIRYALHVAADAARGAWGLGHTPTNQLPQVIAFRVHVPGRQPSDVHLPRPTSPAPRPTPPQQPYQQMYQGPFQQPYPGPYQQPTQPPAPWQGQPRQLPGRGQV